jgi:hypothetical protein
MKFDKTNFYKINLRNDIKNYFSNIINFYNYNLYIGIYNNLYFIFISSEQEYDKIDINIISDYLENNNFIEIKNTNFYLKYPVSIDLINWLKASLVIMEETSLTYQTISTPYIDSIYEKNVKWIFNILNGLTEQNRIMFKNDNFIICKDILWTDNDPYMLCIPFKKIKTIRELTSDDIVLLEEMRDNILNITNNLNIKKNQLYMFFHYHPSYYQLHLHICNINNILLETKIMRYYHLDDIIDKLKMDTNYWKNAILKFELLTNTKLYNLLNNI